MSVRQAEAACAVTQPVVRRWLLLGLLPEVPRGNSAAPRISRSHRSGAPPSCLLGGAQHYVSLERWMWLHRVPTDAKRRGRERGRAKSQSRLPLEVRQQFLAAIRLRRPFRQVLGDLGLTSNQV
jgi:hypothetical protein